MSEMLRKFRKETGWNLQSGSLATSSATGSIFKVPAVTPASNLRKPTKLVKFAHIWCRRSRLEFEFPILAAVLL